MRSEVARERSGSGMERGGLRNLMSEGPDATAGTFLEVDPLIAKSSSRSGEGGDLRREGSEGNLRVAKRSRRNLAILTYRVCVQRCTEI